MRSRVKYTHKDAERACEDIKAITDKCVSANNIIGLIALIRHTGWGHKRIMDFLNTYNETFDDYAQYSKDSVFDIMAEKELSEVGVDLSQLKPDSASAKDKLRESKKQKAPVIDRETIKTIKAQRAEYKGYLKNKEKDG